MLLVDSGAVTEEPACLRALHSLRRSNRLRAFVVMGPPIKVSEFARRMEKAALGAVPVVGFHSALETGGILRITNLVYLAHLYRAGMMLTDDDTVTTLARHSNLKVLRMNGESRELGVTPIKGWNRLLAQVNQLIPTRRSHEH